MSEGSLLVGKRVVVTGGAGFIGSHIVDQLVRAGCAEIVVVDNLVRGRMKNLAWAQQNGLVRLIKGDIRDKDLLSSVIEGADTVFHQAALRITHCAAEPREAFETMAQATYNLLEVCMCERVRKVVYASSASVYGMANEFPTPERQHPYANRTLYGAAKYFGEALLRSFNAMYGLDYVALRYFNVYGPRMDLHGKYTEVLVRWMERLAAGEPPIIFGDGLQTMDFVYVDDVARANLCAAESEATDVALNVASGIETSLVALAKALAAAMEQPGRTPLHVGENTINPVQRRLADVREAQRCMGFTARVPLDEGLRNLVAWSRLEHRDVPRIQKDP